MTSIVDMVHYGFNQRALLAAIMIGFLNGYLGGYIVLRRSSLFAGALSHTLFPGIAIGALIAGLNPVSALIGASITALVIGLLSQSISNHSRVDQNATLAILYTAAFAVGLLILDRIGTYVQIEGYLFGNILGLSNFDLWFAYGSGAIVLSLLILFQRPLLISIFSPDIARTQGIRVKWLDLMLAGLLILTMITSLQAVGSILTLGLLVAPASIFYLFVNSPRALLWGGGLLGALLSCVSIFVSNWLNLQTGAAIVLVLGIAFLAAFILSPRYGLLSRWVHRIRPNR